MQKKSFLINRLLGPHHLRLINILKINACSISLQLKTSRVQFCNTNKLNEKVKIKVHAYVYNLKLSRWCLSPGGADFLKDSGGGREE